MPPFGRVEQKFHRHYDTKRVFSAPGCEAVLQRMIRFRASEPTRATSRCPVSSEVEEPYEKTCRL